MDISKNIKLIIPYNFNKKIVYKKINIFYIIIKIK